MYIEYMVCYEFRSLNRKITKICCYSSTQTCMHAATSRRDGK